ncbi:MAG: hypothetical protein ACK54H_10420, partial [Phycisphaerales bacterium]
MIGRYTLRQIRMSESFEMTQIASSSTAASMTAGAALRHSPALRAAIDTIVAESNRAASTITDVRPARQDLSESYEALMKRCADVRGRALLYPYLGSGLGNGALVELADGSVKWDMICGIGVHFFGHSNPELVRVSAESSVDNVLKHGNLSSN